jgi:hypothetical protein
MSIAEYQIAIAHCVLAAKMMMTDDLPRMIEAIDRAETVGPFLDPTLYRDKAQAMKEDKQILESALPLWKMGKKLEAMKRLE